MATKRKRKEKAERETRRADVIENMVTYLECGDFRPPVKEFYPMIHEFVENTREAAAEFAHGGHQKIVEPCGMIGGADSNDCVFRVDCCWPSARAHIAPLARVSGDATVPRDAVVAKVVTYQIRPDGSARYSIPQFVFSSPTVACDNDIWFPVVTPTPTSAPRRLTSGSGDRGSYREYVSYGSGYTGLLPYLSGMLRLTRTKLWSVNLGSENGLSSLVFLTSDDGVTGFFDLRNGPMAGGRKAALRHFVTAHLRKPKPSRVRCHFRGREEFSWFGLKCSVTPPGRLAEFVESEKSTATILET